jgi:predicted enzyme related to lactoylglutathione lyase
MHRNPVAWFEIHVADMQRAKVFDEAVFNHDVFQLHSITSVERIDSYTFVFLNHLNHLKKQKRIS